MALALALISLLLCAQLLYPFVSVLCARLFYRTPHPRIPKSPNPQFNTSPHPQIPASPNQQIPKSPPTHFACIITAYRNAAIAKPLVESLLGQGYPHLVVYLVADECPEFDFGLHDERFVLLRPDEPLRLKARSILFAMERLVRAHEFVVVFDADNLAHPQFLQEICPFVEAGYRCIQGQRRAKNLDTNYAALDSMGEHYKNFIERETPFRLGSSAVISGSGMATETGLYRAYLDHPEIAEGQHLGKKMLQEDKILQNFLLRRGERIAYARHAIVFDEKVETAAAVETQRSRWLFSYFQNVPNALGILLRGLFSLNFNQLYFGLVTLALPMFIQVGLAMALAGLALFVAPVWTAVLLASLAVFSLNIIWVLRLDGAPVEVRRVVWQVPKFVLRQMLGLLKMRNPDKHFKHTEHRKIISVEDIVRKDSEPPQNVD